MKTFNSFLLASLSASILSACGGGSSDSAPVAASPSPVQASPTQPTTAPVPAAPVVNAPPAVTLAVTASNAKAVAASAIYQTTNALITLAGAAPVIYNTAFLRPGLTLTSATAVNSDAIKAQKMTCGAGGSARLTGGAVAGTKGITVGDTITTTYQYCSPFVYGTPVVFMTGIADHTVIGGGATDTMPFQIVLSSKFTNLDAGLMKTFGSYYETNLINGDQRLDWTGVSTTAHTMVASGTKLTNKSTIGATVRNHVWNDYQQTTSITGTTIGLSFTGLVQSDNPNLGGTGGNFSVSTPTPLIKVTATGALTSGVVKAVGTSNSAVLVTVSPDGAVTVQLDANGDGNFETSLPSTITELNTLL